MVTEFPNQHFLFTQVKLQITKYLLFSFSLKSKCFLWKILAEFWHQNLHNKNIFQVILLNWKVLVFITTNTWGFLTRLMFLGLLKVLEGDRILKKSQNHLTFCRIPQLIICVFVSVIFQQLHLGWGLKTYVVFSFSPILYVCLVACKKSVHFSCLFMYLSIYHSWKGNYRRSVVLTSEDSSFWP